MRELGSLGPLEQRLLDDRFGEHGNSHRRMANNALVVRSDRIRAVRDLVDGKLEVC